MRVFVTGASGWIGTAVVGELMASGHDVVGLARSDVGAARVAEAGAEVLRGDLDDPDSLRRGAADVDAVVHLANKHDWSNPEASNVAERRAVETLGAALVDGGRRLLIAGGVAGLAEGRPATEADASPFHGVESARGGAENLALELAQQGVHSTVVRFAPTVHGHGDHGFIATVAGIARDRGVSGYPGDGANRWAAVHRSDAATLVRLVLERAESGTRWHAVAEEGVTTREIASAIGSTLDLPVAAVPPERVAAHFGWIGRFLGLDMSASSATTRLTLGWRPIGPTLLEDTTTGAYGRVATAPGVTTR